MIFNTGICGVFDNVDQLACVMGHEISHVTLRHSLRQASKSLLNALALVLFAISFEFSLFYYDGFQYCSDVFKLRHSRVHEARADEIGLKYISKAGFDPKEGINMILHLEELELKRLNKDWDKIDEKKRLELIVASLKESDEAKR